MMTIVGLMFVGGSAGSTTGSVKVVRHLLLGKILRREIDQTLHPEIVLPVRLNRRVVDERTLRAVSSFILLYIGIFIVGARRCSRSTPRARGSRSRRSTRSPSRRACSPTSGPRSGSAARSARSSRSATSRRSLMIGLMWLGRLEIVPIVVLVSRHYWRNA